MPDVEVSDLFQTAVYWKQAAPVSYDDYGEPVIAGGQEIPCRWVAKRSGGQGNDDSQVGVAATAIIAVKIPVGSLMWLGRLRDMPGTSFLPDRDVMVVTGYNETTDIRGRSVRRSVKLARYAATLPAYQGE